MKTYARYATAGGHAVDVTHEYEVPGEFRAACSGCPARGGPIGEYFIRTWAHRHAKACSAQAEVTR